jgi:hypothetical protein
MWLPQRICDGRNEFEYYCINDHTRRDAARARQNSKTMPPKRNLRKRNQEAVDEAAPLQQEATTPAVAETTPPSDESTSVAQRSIAVTPPKGRRAAAKRGASAAQVEEREEVNNDDDDDDAGDDDDDEPPPTASKKRAGPKKKAVKKAAAAVEAEQASGEVQDEPVSAPGESTLEMKPSGDEALFGGHSQEPSPSKQMAQPVFVDDNDERFVAAKAAMAAFDRPSGASGEWRVVDALGIRNGQVSNRRLCSACWTSKTSYRQGDVAGELQIVCW